MIRFEHVEKTFPDGTRAVEDFSLEVSSHTSTVLDNVLTVPRLTGRISRNDRDHAHELLELVGLPAAVSSR